MAKEKISGQFRMRAYVIVFYITSQLPFPTICQLYVQGWWGSKTKALIILQVSKDGTNKHRTQKGRCSDLNTVKGSKS